MVARMNLRGTLSHLPREARDTLFLLGVIGCGACCRWFRTCRSGRAHWPACSCFGARVWPFARGHCRRAGCCLPCWCWPWRPRWASFAPSSGREAGVTLIAMLLALKTLEARARRDALVIFFLGFFTMLSNFFFSVVDAHRCGHAGGADGAADSAGQCPHAGGPPAPAHVWRCVCRAHGALWHAGDGGAVRVLPAHGTSVELGDQLSGRAAAFRAACAWAAWRRWRL